MPQAARAAFKMSNVHDFAGSFPKNGRVIIAVCGRVRQVEHGCCASACTFPAQQLICPKQNQQQEKHMANRTAVIQTNKGTIKFELLEEDAPKTTENFRLLAEKGYYDGIIFHRCINGFMIQGGDPTGTGRGGASAWGGKFADEINPSSEVYKRGYKAGTVAMANAGPNTNGSQFFIMHVDYPLPPSYSIFGCVTEGQDVV
ncbi:MAG: peptidylprolyl isomerase, partial [Gammaproteobacteria bacterium]